MPWMEAENTHDKIRRKRRRWNCAISKQSTKCEMEKKERRKKEIRFDFGKYESELKILPTTYCFVIFPSAIALCWLRLSFAIDFACMNGKRVGEEEEKHIKIRKITFYISCESSSFPRFLIRVCDSKTALKLKLWMWQCVDANVSRLTSWY